MAKFSLGRIAYLLALIGGIVMIISGVLSLLGSSIMMFYSPLGGLLGAGAAILHIIFGIVAAIVSKKATDLRGGIILLIVGLLGGGLGGILVAIGGLLGLVSKYV
ncbi:MAG TPA: hypothetical protein VJZ75_03700 [Candidatus Bathyarchaeia archaeon]|nr:hypothetical protein [Candidatus Bathyarchaeia archaeon]